MDKKLKKQKRLDMIGAGCGIILLVLLIGSIILGNRVVTTGANAADIPAEAMTLTGTADGRNGPVSVDTYHAETARRAVDAGAAAINCVYAPDADMWSLVEESGCGFVVPEKDYRVVGAQVLQDPMVGFGTTREEDMAILGSLRRLAARGPVLVGVSRKRVIGTLSGEAEPARRLGGSVGAAVWCAMCGASVVRVHDVKETKEALAVVGALARKGDPQWTGIA